LSGYFWFFEFVTNVVSFLDYQPPPLPGTKSLSATWHLHPRFQLSWTLIKAALVSLMVLAGAVQLQQMRDGDVRGIFSIVSLLTFLSCRLLHLNCRRFCQLRM
jgi:hypothetical protein